MPSLGRQRNMTATCTERESSLIGNKEIDEDQAKEEDCSIHPKQPGAARAGWGEGSGRSCPQDFQKSLPWHIRLKIHGEKGQRIRHFSV